MIEESGSPQDAAVSEHRAWAFEPTIRVQEYDEDDLDEDEDDDDGEDEDDDRDEGDPPGWSPCAP